MKEPVERLISGVLVLCAVVVATTVVHREFVSTTGERSGASQQGAPSGFTEAWQEALPVGRLMGDDRAPIKVVVLSDLECPFCGRFHALMKGLLKERRRDVAMVFVHYPLEMHRFALPAARAAECANDEGKFEAFVDQVFAKQDSLGLISWGTMAAAAGVADTARIAQCALRPGTSPRIKAGIAFALKIGAVATPTVIVNGLRYPHPPSASDLRIVLDSIVKNGTGNGSALGRGN